MTALISEEYRGLNAALHRADQFYGISGKRFVEIVAAVANKLGTRSILDYGCGKRTLESKLGFAIANYDPCIPGLDASPPPATIVVCTEVLEHIEPECVDAVLDDLKRVTDAVVILSIATGPAEKSLADGRNAHLIQQPREWWRPKLDASFTMCRDFDVDGGFVFIGESKRYIGNIPDFGDIGPPVQTKTIRTKSCYPDEKRCDNIRSAMLRGLQQIPIIPAHGKTMVLACYGPSLSDTLPELREDVRRGGDLYSVSGAHSFLIERGIVPMAHTETDPRPHKAEGFGRADARVVYFLASACDRAMFEAVHGIETWLFHVTSSNMETELIAKLGGNFTVDGGTNVGMSAIGLGTALGYRRFSIYGMDGSFKADPELLHWQKDQPMPPTMRGKTQFHAGWHPNEDQDLYRVWVGDKPFVSSPQMFQGAQDFAALATSRRDLQFRLHGDGFLKALMEHIGYGHGRSARVA